MKNRECVSCIKRKTPYCPITIECMATEDMPYYQNRMMLLKENQELKEKVKKLSQWDNNKDSRNSRQRVANAELKKQVEDLFSENRNLRKKLEKCMTFEDYKYTLNKKIKLETQQKEFIKYLEDYINSLKKEYGNYVNDNYSEEYGRYYTAKEILQKYKSIIGDDK